VGLGKFFEILPKPDPPLWRTLGFATNFYGTPAAGSPPKMRLFPMSGNFQSKHGSNLVEVPKDL